MRTAEISRDTRETKIYLKIDLDGRGRVSVDTGVGFFNHMLELFGVHSGVDLTVRCEGDTDVDFHHSVEDVGICLGKAFKEALGDKKGIARFADRVVPMDECAALVALDISGRPFLNFEKKMSGKIGEFDAELVEEFMRAFASQRGRQPVYRPVERRQYAPRGGGDLQGVCQVRAGRGENRVRQGAFVQRSFVR